MIIGHLTKLMYYWLYYLCCTLNPHDLFYNWKLVPLNPLHFFPPVPLLPSPILYVTLIFFSWCIAGLKFWIYFVCSSGSLSSLLYLLQEADQYWLANRETNSKSVHRMGGQSMGSPDTPVQSHQELHQSSKSCREPSPLLLSVSRLCLCPFRYQWQQDPAVIIPRLLWFLYALPSLVQIVHF